MDFKNGHADYPVNLNEVYEDLKKEGFAIDKVIKDNDTQLIKFDLTSVENHIKTSPKLSL